MDAGDDLHVPTAVEEEARAAEVVRSVATVIGALACAEGLVSPRRFEAAVAAAQSVGSVLREPNLTRVLTLRALSSPQDPRPAIVTLKAVANKISAPDRAIIMRRLAGLLGDDAKPTIIALAPELAVALGVPLPDGLRHGGPGILDALGDWADRMKRVVHAEPPLLVAAREFFADFGEIQMAEAIVNAQRTGDVGALARALVRAADVVREQVKAVAAAAAAQADNLGVAKDLDAAADKIEQVAKQRYAAMTRRATMMKRHLRGDLDALVEDAAEEFEVDFRRMAEAKKSWFGQVETADLNDRMVVKNLERRYERLARRYQDQIDLSEREISEYCEEFTRLGDEALRPMARYEFRAIAPHPRLELRVKAAADRAAGRTLAAGAVGAAAAGAAVHAGLIAGVAVAGVAAAPVGIAVLGAVALAGVWKAFATPDERRRRDLRARSLDLEQGLRGLIMANLPRFEETIDAAVARYRGVVVPDIAGPRVEAERLREIAKVHEAVASGVVEAANVRLRRLVPLLEAAQAGF